MPSAHLCSAVPRLAIRQNSSARTTKNRTALAAFKKAALEEAHLNLLGCDDAVLRIEYEEELHKLEKLLNALIPDNAESDND